MYEGRASIDQQQTYDTSVKEGEEGGHDNPSNPKSSSIGLSDWSSDDGFSSIGLSSFATVLGLSLLVSELFTILYNHHFKN